MTAKAMKTAAAAARRGRESMRRLMIVPGRCIGCRTCELSCAFSHSHGRFVLGKSRCNNIHYPGGRHITMLCLQCEDPACARVCPVDAIVRNVETGAMEIRRERCIHCNVCVPACPFGNISIDPVDDHVVKCDLCGGDPMCARFCPSETLVYR